jgi:hypothetical protein
MCGEEASKALHYEEHESPNHRLECRVTGCLLGEPLSNKDDVHGQRSA